MSSKFNLNIEHLKLLILNDDIKIISFDIFDTLLVRPTLIPSDAFYLLQEKARIILCNDQFDFYKVRSEAESQARILLSKKNKNYGEITLSQIYEYIANSNGINNDIKEKLIQAEIDLETHLLQPRPIGKEIYDFAIESGKKVIITSDMYLGKDVLENILIKKKYDGFARLYVSSEHKKRKDTGELFQLIIQSEKLKPSQILHIGDNMESDVLCALKSGIVAFHLPSNKEIFFSNENNHYNIWDDFNSLSPITRISIGLCANKLIDRVIEKPGANSIFPDHYHLGYYGLGPLVFNLAASILSNHNVQAEYTYIHFASRDGYLPQIIYDLIRNNDKKYLESKYIYCGRQAYDIAKYDGDVLKYLTSKTNHLGNYTLGDLLDALVQKNFFAGKRFTNKIETILYNDDYKEGFKNLKRLIKEYGDEIREILSKRKQVVEEYYNSSVNLNANNRAIIFDVGYSGSVSNDIGKLTKSKIDKIYLWQTDKNEENDNNNKTKTIVLAGYQESRFNNPPLDIILEELFSPLEQACVGFKESPDGSFVPIFFEDEPFSKNMINDLGEIQRGAIDFTRDAINLFSSYVSLKEFNEFKTFLRVLKYSFNSPTDNGVRLLENIIFSDRFCKK